MLTRLDKQHPGQENSTKQTYLSQSRGLEAPNLFTEGSRAYLLAFKVCSLLVDLSTHRHMFTHNYEVNMSTDTVRVILADDHAVVRKGIREFLTEPGDIEVVAEASDGDEAIALIEQHRPDVVVLDIQMPKRSGIDVCRHIRTQQWPVGILILTAYDDDPYVLAVLQAGANGYVLKTADADEIVRAVRDVHEGKSALDPNIARKLMTQLTRQAAAKPAESLTAREMDVLKLAARGYTNKAIAAQLSISDRTVQGHLANIFSKLHVATRTEAVMCGVSLGWIPSVLGEPEQEYLRRQIDF